MKRIKIVNMNLLFAAVPDPDCLEYTTKTGLFIRLVNQDGYNFSQGQREYGIHLMCDSNGWELEIGFGARVLRIGRD